MPRKGASMTKAEMWTLLTTINDELVMLSTAMAEMQKCIEGSKKHQEEVEVWQDKHAAVLSAKVPKELAERVDRLLETRENRKHTRSSLITQLLTEYCNTWEDVWRTESQLWRMDMDGRYATAARSQENTAPTPPPREHLTV